ncbi:MAG: UDP-galactose-lipid carrier transferase [Acidimicrobiales bacterium]
MADRQPPAGRLAQIDLSRRLARDEEGPRLEAASRRLLQLRLVLGGHLAADGTLHGERQLGPPVCVVFEGWDAAGKGGAIRRLVAPLDPRHVHVAQFAAPSAREKRHHFLWRFWPVLPGWGGMTVLDRSWYGRVLVERVEGFATAEQWGRAYQEIVEFERTLVAEGTILLKFWLEISDTEQLDRFERRARDLLKAWKLGDEDWRNRGKRAVYEAAVEEMVVRTDHPAAPWILIPAESKRYARVAVVEHTVAALEEGLAARGFGEVAPLAGRRSADGAGAAGEGGGAE